MTEKRYSLYNVGLSYLTSCGITTGEDCFENMTECCEELNRLSDENEQLKTQVSPLARVNCEGDEQNLMIKKRFEFGSPDYRQGAHYSIIDNETNREMLSQEEIMDKLNQLAYEKYILVNENNQLKQVIAEDEKIISSTYDELTKLRCIKKNLVRIKTQWDWIMEAVQYD